MGFSLQIPVVGQPHAIEDVKVGNDLQTIATWGNGNIADSDLASPNNAVRKLRLQAGGLVVGGLAADWLFLLNGGLVNSTLAQAGSSVAIWAGDAGLSGQPPDFQVPNKAAFARVRANAMANGVSSGVTFTLGLYQVTALGGSSGQISYTFAAAIAGSTIALAPSAGQALNGESGQFALPSADAYYALGVKLSGALAASAAVALTAQLYGYNA